VTVLVNLLGAAIYPSRIPIMTYALEKPLIWFGRTWKKWIQKKCVHRRVYRCRRVVCKFDRPRLQLGNSLSRPLPILPVFFGIEVLLLDYSDCTRLKACHYCPWTIPSSISQRLCCNQISFRFLCVLPLPFPMPMSSLRLVFMVSLNL
jgi:hypothetical protein